MSQDPNGWLTVEQATIRSGASPATIRRYAAGANHEHARRVPMVTGGTKLRWWLEVAALDAWSADRRHGSLGPPSGLKPIDLNWTDARGNALEYGLPDGLAERVATLERTMAALVGQVEGLRGVAIDEVQAARTAALTEKAVSEGLRAAQKAQGEASAARAASQRLQEEATVQARVAADKEAEAATAVGIALDSRSRQLDELLTPGSAILLTGESIRPAQGKGVAGT